jgi:uncharacterized protein (TIGR03083 family)
MDPITVIATEARRFDDVLATADPDTRVPTCPDWNAVDLLWHLTEVHYLWAGILGTDARTSEDVEAVEKTKPDRPDTIAEILPLHAEATAALLVQLRRLDDGEPRWTWWEPDQTVGFTRRMQTHEATMHRVDAELTVGIPVGSIGADVAAAGVDHCVDVMWGWQPEWGQYEPLTMVGFEATDTGQSWLVEIGHWAGTSPNSGREFDWPLAKRANTGEPRALVRGTAQELDLWAWGRRGQVSVDGEPDARAVVDRLIAHGIR